MQKVTMLGTGLIGMFYTMTLHAGRSADRVTMVYSRTPERAEQFAQEWGIPNHSTDLEAAINDPETGVVVIGLPNNQHDSDSDGIPDFYEIHYRGSSTVLAADENVDEDAWSALGEFAFALNPDLADGYSVTPVSIEPSSGPDRDFTITYIRPQAGPALLNYREEVSFDLETWSSDPADVEEVSITPLEGGVEQVKVRAAVSLGSTNRIFMRVHVEKL